MTKRDYTELDTLEIYKQVDGHNSSHARKNVLMYFLILYTVTENFRTATKARTFLSGIQFAEH